MLRAVKRQFLVQWEDWILMGVLALAGTLFGGIMAYVLRGTEGGIDSFFPLGVLMGIILTVFYSALSIMTGVGNYFNMEISMGCTRKEFFISYFMVSFIWNVVGVVWLSLLCIAESSLARLAAPGVKQEVDFLPYLWEGGIPAALAIPMIAGFLGALVMRFGKKAFWIMWAVWMILVLGGPRVADAMEEAPDSLYGNIGTALASMVKAVPGNAWIILGTTVSLACFAGTYILLRKQSVTV